MRARRLLSCLLAAIWLSPVALSGAMALHVALEHAHHDAAAHDDGAAPRLALADVLEHGHAHGEGEAGHRHLSLPAAAVAARIAAAASTAASVAGVSSGTPLAAVPHAASGRDRTGLSPPRASGPSLLARLAVFRI